MTSILKATLVLALLMVGTFATLGAAQAQSEEHRGLVGSITGTGVAAAGSPLVGSFVLTLKGKDGDVTSPVTIKVNSDTKFKVPGDKSVNLGNYTSTFKEGSRVAVLAKKVGSDYFALHVHLIPAKGLSHSHHVGTITAYDFEGAGSITLQPKKGGPVTYSWGATAVPTIKFTKGATALAGFNSTYTGGQRATVIVKRDPATGQFTARQIVVLPTNGKGPKK